MQNTSPKKSSLGWDKRLHIERPGALKKCCVVCASPFWIPPSKHDQRRCCANHECVSSVGSVIKERRSKPCETCGVVFVPRPTLLRAGKGRFCSQACNTASHSALTSPESLSKGKQTMREKRASGEYVHPRGPENKQWKGGPKAAAQRRQDSGKAAEALRAYRKANPDKVREFRVRRSTLKGGAKLPRGTVPAIRKAQGNRCAICRVSLKGGSHLDHIVPLARGGKHEGRNLQLLCPPCNLAKSDKDPIDHMQSLGRLL